MARPDPFTIYRMKLIASVADSEMSHAAIRISFWSVVELTIAIILAYDIRILNYFAQGGNPIEDMVILKRNIKRKTPETSRIRTLQQTVNDLKKQAIQHMVNGLKKKARQILRRRNSSLKLTTFYTSDLRIEHTTYESCRRNAPPRTEAQVEVLMGVTVISSNAN